MDAITYDAEVANATKTINVIEIMEVNKIQILYLLKGVGVSFFSIYWNCFEKVHLT